MSKFDFRNYSNGIITVEIQSMMPERFINLLWKNGVEVKNVKKETITTMTMDICLKDYNMVEEIAKKTKTRIKIVGRKGIAFFIIMLKKRVTLAAGLVIFICILYYLSTYIWGIEIECDQHLTPFEIRQQLLSFGVRPGIKKGKINVYEIEDKLIKSNDSIMWVRARIEGAKLKVSAEERQSPPEIIADDSPCNLIANRDSQVTRVYTKAGTAVVKKDDIVKRGQLLVKGEQGREGMVYKVHAQGDVIGRTFYEESDEIKVTGVKRVRTGNSLENVYINVNGKKIYLKKSLNVYEKYDKIENNKSFVKREVYYEVKEVPFELDTKKAIDECVDELYKKITFDFDKGVKIVDKVINAEPQGDSYKVRLLIVAEENIAVPEKTQK